MHAAARHTTPPPPLCAAVLVHDKQHVRHSSASRRALLHDLITSPPLRSASWRPAPPHVLGEETIGSRLMMHSTRDKNKKQVVTILSHDKRRGHCRASFNLVLLIIVPSGVFDRGGSGEKQTKCKRQVHASKNELFLPLRPPAVVALPPRPAPVRTPWGLSIAALPSGRTHPALHPQTRWSSLMPSVNHVWDANIFGGGRAEEGEGEGREGGLVLMITHGIVIGVSDR